MNLDYFNKIIVVKGDITTVDAEALVNAANNSLLGGGGVDGAIHKAAGPELLKACRKLNGCETGKAKITKAYNLNSRYIIHTPGPKYFGGKSGEKQLLESSYKNSMLIAKDFGCKSIAFPAISTGIYSYPKESACETALNTVFDFVDKESYYPVLYFVLFDDDNFNLYQKFILRLKNELQTAADRKF